MNAGGRMKKGTTRRFSRGRKIIKGDEEGEDHEAFITK